MKDIVFHGTQSIKLEGDKLRLSRDGTYGEGVYVQTNSGEYFAGTFGSSILSIIINTKNPYNFEKEDGTMNDLWLQIRDKHEKSKKYYWADNAKEEFHVEIKKLGYDSIKSQISEGDFYYVLFESEQTHILGSEQDIKNFKEFIENKK